MYKKLKYSLFIIFAIATLTISIAPGSSVSASVPCPDGTHGTPPDCVPNDPLPPGFATCNDRVFTFPAWYRGLSHYDAVTGSCNIEIDSITDLIKIPLNILDILIQAVAYAAVGFIVWGGFKYIKSQGDPGKISEAKSAIINAVTGLGVALLSVAIVEFIQGRFS